MINFKTFLLENIDKENLKKLVSNIEKSPVDKDLKLIKINVDKFDKAWSKDKDFYIGKGGSLNAIGNRYKFFLDILNKPAEERKRFLSQSKSGNIIASGISVNNLGEISFSNGRHRYSVLRDLGIKKIPVSMSKESIKNAKKFNYI